MNAHHHTPFNGASTLALLLLATHTLILPVPLSAQTPGKRLVTPQDLWAMKRLSAPELSPDGRTAAV